MPRRQWVQGVGGGGGEPISTNARGVIQTDNYPSGGEIKSSTDSYPIEVNPAETIQELNVTQHSDALVVEVHTTGGDVFEAFAGGTLGSRDKWEIDKVVVSDPDSSGATFSAEWAGE